MTQKYDWGGIRNRFESGETSGAISKSMAGSPTRQGIQKRANREGWLKISVDAKEAVRNLPSIQNPTFQRAPSNELGHRSQKNAERILSAVERGAPPKIAADLVGLTLGQFKTWMTNDHQFAMEIKARVAQIVAEHVRGIRNAGDWRAWKWILEHDPSSREEYGPQRRKDEGPTIILKIFRDEVPVDNAGNVIDSVAMEEREEPLPDTPCLESAEVLELETKRPKECWQGDNWREKQTMDEHRACEERLALGIKSR